MREAPGMRVLSHSKAFGLPDHRLYSWLMAGGITLGKMRRESACRELLKKIGDGSSANANERAFKHQSRSAVPLGVVKSGDTAGGEGAEKARVVELPAFFVALANHGVGERVQNAR